MSQWGLRGLPDSVPWMDENTRVGEEEEVEQEKEGEGKEGEKGDKDDEKEGAKEEVKRR